MGQERNGGPPSRGDTGAHSSREVHRRGRTKPRPGKSEGAGLGKRWVPGCTLSRQLVGTNREKLGEVGGELDSALGPVRSLEVITSLALQGILGCLNHRLHLDRECGGQEAGGQEMNEVKWGTRAWTGPGLGGKMSGEKNPGSPWDQGFRGREGAPQGQGLLAKRRQILEETLYLACLLRHLDRFYPPNGYRGFASHRRHNVCCKCGIYHPCPSGGGRAGLRGPGPYLPTLKMTSSLSWWVES